MNSSDKIALGALILSAISLLYTFFSNKENKKNEIKNEKLSFLKSLNKIIRGMSFTDSDDTKNNILDLVREELNYVCSFDDNISSFNEFSEKIDDKVFLLSRSTCINDFTTQKEEIIQEIKLYK